MLRPESLTLDSDSRALYERFVPVRHPLRRFDETLDFSFILPLVAERYHDEIGRPAEHPERMWRLLFAEYYLNLSDEKVCLAAHESLALRLFLRLGIDEEPPHPTTLQKFRANRLDGDVYLKIHFELLRQAEAHRLLRRDERQIFDTSHVRSNTRVVSLPRLLLEARAKVVKEIAKIDADYGAELATQAEADYQTYLAARAKRREEGAPKPTKEEKVDAARGPVRRTLEEVQARITDKRLVPTERLNVAVAVLAKVIADREDGASERIVSVHDIEARKGKKTTVVWDGRKLAVTVTDQSYFIVGAAMGAGNDNDCEWVAPLLDQEQAQFGLVPRELTADKAADIGYVRKDLEDRGIVAHIPLSKPDNPQGENLYKVADFLYDPQKLSLTCPNGHTSTERKHDKAQARDGYVYRFKSSWCRACPPQAKCLSPKTKRFYGRTAYINTHRPVFERAQRRNEGDEFKTAYKRRGRIEPKIWELVYHGPRR